MVRTTRPTPQRLGKIDAMVLNSACLTRCRTPRWLCQGLTGRVNHAILAKLAAPHTDSAFTRASTRPKPPR